LKNHIFKTFAKLHISSLKTRLYINNIKFKLIVLSITTVFFSCNSVDHQINDVRSENIKIYEPYSKNKDLEKLISPYREKLKELEKVLGYSAKSLSIRDGELESTLGNLIADILIEESNPVFYDITSKNIDFCLLNFGGVRGSLNKGNITQHDLFTIMPFNNTSTVVKLSGKKVLELLQYFNIENLAHPVSGIKVEFEEEKLNKVTIQNKKFDINKTYYVLTSNYCQEGGDRMNFFKNPLELYSLNTNIREVLINYISKKKVIHSNIDGRIKRIK